MITTYILTLLLSFGLCQQTVPTVLHFRHLANGQLVERNKPFKINDTETYKIKQWKYYISHLELLSEKGKVISIPGIFLIDAFGNDSINFQSPNGKFTAIKFSIGIDSIMHMSGAQDGALDPLNGMYWAWNTGFMHYKLEGEKQTLGNNLQKLQYHIGGFSGKNNTNQTINIPLQKSIHSKKSTTPLPDIFVDLTSFFDNPVVKNEKPLIMKEGNDAVEISKTFPSMFSIKNIASAAK